MTRNGIVHRLVNGAVFLYKCCQKIFWKTKIRLTIPFLCIIIDWSVYNGGET